MRASSVCLSNSQRWVQQQALDPFVAEARRKGYVARSAFKLTYIDDRFKLFERHRTRAVIDLGCSPGGWCQVIRERCGDRCLLFGLDLLNVQASVPNAVFLQGDFRSPEVKATLLDKLGSHQLLPSSPSHGNITTLPSGSGQVDVITSDMCPNRSGGAQDRQRICELNMSALEFSVPLLRPGGSFVCKVLGSRSSFEDLHAQLSRWFLRVHICKPPASRTGSDEAFLVGVGRLAERRQSAPSAGGVGRGGGQHGLDDWPGFARRKKK